jgi:beta-phosphoglucomutase family hydrolase
MQKINKQLDIDPKAKGLIFDIDGTLADTMPLHYEAWREICLNNGFDFPLDLFYKVAGTPTYKIALILNETFNVNLNPHEVLILKEELFLKNLQHVKPIKIVTDIVYKYYGKIPMSVGTGGRKDIAKLILKSIGLDTYFDIIVSAEDVDNHKPNPDTFLKCAELMKIKPQFCQVFEDAEQGLEAARRAGMIITDIRPYLL